MNIATARPYPSKSHLFWYGAFSYGSHLLHGPRPYVAHYDYSCITQEYPDDISYKSEDSFDELDAYRFPFASWSIPYYYGAADEYLYLEGTTYMWYDGGDPKDSGRQLMGDYRRFDGLMYQTAQFTTYQGKTVKECRKFSDMGDYA